MANNGVNGPGYNAGYAYFQQLEQIDPAALQAVEAEDPELVQEVQSGNYTPQQINNLLMKDFLRLGKNLQNLPPAAQKAVTEYQNGQSVSESDMDAFLSAAFALPA